VLVLVQLETEGERLYEDWKGLLHFIDILCCCAALLPIIWQVSILEKNSGEEAHSRDFDDDVDEAELESYDDANCNNDSLLVEAQQRQRSWGHETPATETPAITSHSFLSQDQQRAIMKLKLFRQFYLILVTYIYITRVVVFLVAGWLGFRYSWVSSFLNEAAALAFYVSTGHIFRPRDEFTYVGLMNEMDDKDDKHYEEEEGFVNDRGVSPHGKKHRIVELT
jgi:hypothetical protein